MNKKLSQLSEKVTSLSADDLLLVSTGGVSKSIKASTLEAPLKAYADQKKSEVISEIQAVEASLDSEITNRQAADTNTLNSAKAYTDAEILEEVSAREAADATTLSSAVSYIEGALLNNMSNVNTLIVQNLDAAKAYTDNAVSQVSPSGASIPVGVIQMYAGTSAPSGWLLCDGSAVSRSAYSALFTLIGTSYGTGNGITTFNLPNPDTNANLRLIIKV